MILECKDFLFDNETIKNNYGLLSVNFDDDTTLPSAIVREMDVSEMTQYRSETTGYSMKYTDVLEFDIHLTKDYCDASDQNELRLEVDEYERIVSWLTSPQRNKWLSIITLDNNEIKVKGYFSSVTPFDVSGHCYGVKCTFTCNSPFSYVEKEYTEIIAGYKSLSLVNESSEKYDYVKPTILLTPKANQEIFIHNTSDSDVMDSGTIDATSDKLKNIDELIKKVELCAALDGGQTIYFRENDGSISTICDNTALLFYIKDSYGITKKCTAYYIEGTGRYYVCSGGFFYCTTLLELKIKIDSKNLGIYDSLNRPVLFSRIGIQDEDEIYWLRLVHGANLLNVKGNMDLTITYLEPKKGMLV